MCRAIADAANEEFHRVLSLLGEESLCVQGLLRLAAIATGFIGPKRTGLRSEIELFNEHIIGRHRADGRGRFGVGF